MRRFFALGEVSAAAPPLPAGRLIWAFHLATTLSARRATSESECLRSVPTATPMLVALRSSRVQLTLSRRQRTRRRPATPVASSSRLAFRGEREARGEGEGEGRLEVRVRVRVKGEVEVECECECECEG